MRDATRKGLTMDCVLAETGGGLPVPLILAALAVIAVGAALIRARSRATKRKSLPLFVLLPMVLVAAIVLPAAGSAVAATDDCISGVMATPVPTPSGTAVPSPTPTVTEPVDCGENQEPVDAGCGCVEGFVPGDDGTCVPGEVQCGDNEVPIDGVCTCAEGFEPGEDGTCQPAALFCGVNEVGVENRCLCQDGYARTGDGVCVRTAVCDEVYFYLPGGTPPGELACVIAGQRVAESPIPDVTTERVLDPPPGEGGQPPADEPFDSPHAG